MHAAEAVNHLGVSGSARIPAAGSAKTPDAAVSETRELQVEVKRLRHQVGSLSAQAKNEERANRQIETLQAEVLRLKNELRRSEITRKTLEQKVATKLLQRGTRA
jgi:predicted RNase H-like nuclease (RuvC/YqgF family)